MEKMIRKSGVLLLGVFVQRCGRVGFFLGGLCLTIFCNVSCFGEIYPSRPIRSIVPFPAGGAADLVSRIFALQLSEQLGQPVVVDNRGGASGVIGVQLGAKAPADGYTLVQAGSTNFAMAPALSTDLPYDPVKDFSPIALLAYAPNVLVGHPSVNARSISELIQFAKSHPAQLTYASPGTGTTSHIFGELFTHMAGVQLLHIPYKGGGPAFIELLSGQVTLLFGALSTSLPSIKTGKLKGFGVTSASRTPVAPELPTIAESGLPGYEALQWFGIAVPKATEKKRVDRLSVEFNRILIMEPIKLRLLQAGLESAKTNSSVEFSRYIQSEVIRWSRVVKQAGIRATPEK